MNIVASPPPNIDAISRAFPLSGNEIFAWGDTIYNPSGSVVTDHLIAHESIHRKQQGEDVNGWWERYLVDAEWRLNQELEAHQAEYRSFCAAEKDRNRRALFLYAIAKRLSAPMYGGLIGHKEAMKRISAHG